MRICIQEVASVCECAALAVLPASPPLPLQHMQHMHEGVTEVSAAAVMSVAPMRYVRGVMTGCDAARMS